MFLSRTVRTTHMLVRGKALSDTMSRYLIRRIEETPNIELRVETEIVALDGVGALGRVTWLDQRTGERSTHAISHVLMMTARLRTPSGSAAVWRSTARAIKVGAD